jgi:LmbE family N-acetylglucosaminyl deacetylase
MAKAKEDGHRVVLVVATRGELGEVADGFLAPGETLAERRVQETLEAAAILGVDRVEFLGYHDSGMMGEATNGHNGSFWSTGVDEAAARVAAILADERADVLTVYDDHGGYGHPDHVQVHRVGHRAAELAGTPWVYDVTMNRDYLRTLITEYRLLAEDDPGLPDAPAATDLDDFGTPEALLTTRVDVQDYTDRKREAMAAHASQIDENSFFLQMPPDAFRAAFGFEFFIRRGAEPGIRESSLFER